MRVCWLIGLSAFLFLFSFFFCDLVYTITLLFWSIFFACSFCVNRNNF